MRRVSTLAVSLVLLLLITGPATADTRITSEERTQVAMGEQTSDTTAEVTLWFGEGRAARLTPDGRMISRPDRGEAYLVNDAQKSYTVLDLDKSAPTPEMSASITKSDETRKIGSWSARRYDLEFELAPGETGHAVLWMSTDVDVDLDLYRSFTESIARATGMGWLTQIAELEGYPVLQETSVGVVRVTTRLLSIAEETPPAGIYEPPSGYERKE